MSKNDDKLKSFNQLTTVSTEELIQMAEIMTKLQKLRKDLDNVRKSQSKLVYAYVPQELTCDKLDLVLLSPKYKVILHISKAKKGDADVVLFSVDVHTYDTVKSMALEAELSDICDPEAVAMIDAIGDFEADKKDLREQIKNLKEILDMKKIKNNIQVKVPTIYAFHDGALNQVTILKLIPDKNGHPPTISVEIIEKVRKPNFS